MYKAWSCVIFDYSFNRFPPANENRISTSSKWFIWRFIKGLHGFILSWTFLIFLDVYEKNPRKREKVDKNCFDKQEKSWTYLKIFRKKHKNFKAVWAVLGHSKPKIFSVGQLWWPTFFGDLGLPNYFSAAAALTR